MTCDYVIDTHARNTLVVDAARALSMGFLFTHDSSTQSVHTEPARNSVEIIVTCVLASDGAVCIATVDRSCVRRMRQH